MNQKTIVEVLVVLGLGGVAYWGYQKFAHRNPQTDARGLPAVLTTQESEPVGTGTVLAPKNVENNGESSWLDKIVNAGSDFIHSIGAFLPDITTSISAQGAEFHNPTNIMFTDNSVKNPWKGQTGFFIASGKKFVKFSDDLYGFRAAAYLIKKKRAQGINTVYKLINNWAPASENLTKNYIGFVSEWLKKDPNAILTDADMPVLIQGMAKMEVGKHYDLNLIKQAIKMV